jgi:hypothetical protein
MVKIWLSLVLVYVLVFTAAPVLVGSPSDRQAQTLEQVREKIGRLGVSEKARVIIRLRNGTKLKGYIQQAGENEFVLNDKEMNAPVHVLYDDVARVEDNRGGSLRKKIGIGAVVFLGVMMTLAAIGLAHAD